MRFGRRDIFEDVAATLLATVTVMGFTATPQHWDVWLIGDSRRWSAGLLTLLGVAMFGLTARHIGRTLFAVLGCAGVCFAGLAFATALAHASVAARSDHHPRLGAGSSPGSSRGPAEPARAALK